MKVLIALDDSGGSHHALDWVLRCLFPVGNGYQPATEARHELVLVHALEPLHHPMCPVGRPGDDQHHGTPRTTLYTSIANIVWLTTHAGSAVYGAPSIMQSVRAARKESARNLLDRAKRVCHRRGVRESRHRCA